MTTQPEQGQSPRSDPRRDLAALAVVIVICVAVFALLQSTRGFPFSSTDDGPIYFVPLIKAHTDAWLRKAPGAYLWSLGSGHSVWESGQLGPVWVLGEIVARGWLWRSPRDSRQMEVDNLGLAYHQTPRPLSGGAS